VGEHREPRPGRLRTAVGRVRQVPRTRLTAGAAVLALAVSVPFGGLKQSYAETHPAVAAGPDQLMHADPFSITVTGASVVDDLRSYYENGTSKALLKPSDPSNHLITVRATVVNTSPESVSSELLKAGALDPDGVPLGGVLYLTVPGGELVEPDGLLSVDDASSLTWLSPGVPYHLVIVTEVSGAFPTTATIGVARLSYDLVAYSPTYEWQHPDPAYQLTVPVVDKRGTKQRPEGWSPAPGDDG
jgi:hypothetical protein